MEKKKVITAAEAALLIKDGDTVATSGFVGSGCPEALTRAVEARFLDSGVPRNLTCFYAAAQGNRDGRGADHFAHKGLVKRVIGGHYNMAPALGKLILDGDIEGYNLPQGTLSQLFRDIAAGKPGTITRVTKNSIEVQTGKGTLAILELQIEGKKRMTTDAFLCGYSVEEGTVFKRG